MKNSLILFMVSLFLVSCEEQGDLTSKGTIDTPISATAQLLYTGDFTPTSGIEVAGQVKIVQENNVYKLELSNFSISNGPDLKVYLSKSNTPNQFVTLGNLTSARVYTIPNTVDFTVYTHVLIHCQQYNHLFATATLIPN